VLVVFGALVEGFPAQKLLLNALYASPDVDGVTCNIAGLPHLIHSIDQFQGLSFLED
jgi:hypothetical protein